MESGLSSVKWQLARVAPTLSQNLSKNPVFQRFGDKFSNISILNPRKLPLHDEFVNFMRFHA